MAHKIAELDAKMSPERRARVKARTQQMLDEMPLHAIRRARRMTQAQLAEQMGKKQPEISTLERQAEMYVGTMRRFIEAMGGELDLVARFPDGTSCKVEFTEPLPDSATYDLDQPTHSVVTDGEDA